MADGPHTSSQKELPLRRATFVLITAFSVLAASCGSDDALSTSSTEGGMEMVDDSAMDEMANDGHAHEHGDDAPITAWPADVDEPVVTIDAVADDAGTIDMHVAVTGFTIIGGDPTEPAPNEGHVHVYIDGHDLGMFFSNDITLEDVAPGSHQLMVELAAPDHSVFSLGGSAMRYMTEVVVPGDVVAADTVIAAHIGQDGAEGGVVEASASIGDLVEIQVMSEVDERLHVHGYDRYVDLTAGETATLRFDALIPGVFEIELEGAGRQVIELTVS